MGWFDISVVKDDRRHSHSHKDSHHDRRHSSSAGSKKHHSSSSRSLFGLGDGHNSSRSSFFGFGGGRSSSYYKRSPRKGFINRALHQLRRLFRDLIYYMKKNPIKVFVLVIMPLITGGALTALLAMVGIRLPHSIERVIRSMGGGGSEFGVGRGRDGGLQFERERYDGPLGGMGAAMGAMGGASGLINVAKMFI